MDHTHDTDAGTPRLVGAAASAARILRHLAASPAPQPLTPIARALGLNVSTCLGILRTLAEFELVRCDAPTKTYSIGLGVLDLARGLLAGGGEAALIRPMMHEVAQRHGITVTLWRRMDPDRMVLTLVVESDRAMRIRMVVGQRLPVFIGATGRVMAAHSGLDAAALQARFEALRWQNPPRFETWLKQVEAARHEGWALDESNYVQGTTTLATPVPGRPDLVCSGTMFERQHGPEALRHIARDLLGISAVLARGMS